MGKQFRLQRRAATLLEVILGIPVLLIVLFAVVEFGLLFSNLQRLEMASRAGASVASQRDLGGPGALNTDVRDAILRSLDGSGITVGRITLEHTYDSMNPGMIGPLVVQTDGALNCPAPIVPSAPAGIYARPHVRVILCAEMTELAPNCLAFFGVDFSNRVSQKTTTFRHEF